MEQAIIDGTTSGNTKVSSIAAKATPGVGEYAVCSEDSLRYLEMLQQCISRMANSSFLIKGWTITLAAATTVLSSRDTDLRFALVACLPALVFWALDAFYMRQERLFREIYRDAVEQLRSGGQVCADLLFCLDTRTVASRVPPFPESLLARTVWPVHLTVVATVVIVLALTGAQEAPWLGESSLASTTTAMSVAPR